MRHSKARPLRVATWNVHGCVGSDGIANPKRVAAVLERIDADVVGLQEVDCRRTLADGRNQLEYLAEHTSLSSASGPTRYEHGGYFGNALLSRFPIARAAHLDLSVPGREPRGLLDAVVATELGDIRTINTHFGLRSAERREQLQRLLAALDASKPNAPILVLGDFNEWRPNAWVLLQLHTRLGFVAPVRSFPARFPLFALDRIWFHPAGALQELHAFALGSARQASDHLPVIASVDWCAPDAWHARCTVEESTTLSDG